MALPISFRYNPEKQDYIHASRMLALHSRGFLALAVVVIIGMLASAVVLLLPDFGDVLWRNGAVVMLMVGLFFLVYFWGLIPIQLARAYKTTEHLRTERELTLTEKHIRMRVGDDIMELPWANLQKVVYSNHYYLFIFVAENRIYPFIPSRALQDEAEEQALKDLLAEKAIPMG